MPTIYIKTTLIAIDNQYHLHSKDGFVILRKYIRHWRGKHFKC